MADSTVRYAYPKFKVFIYGVELTSDVLSVTSSQHDTSSPNTCQITISNELDKYVLTTDDMRVLSGNGSQTLNIPWLTKTLKDSQSANNALNVYTIDQTSDSYRDALTDLAYANTTALKYRILQEKRLHTSSINVSDRKDPLGNPITTTGTANYYGTSISRYPLKDGASVFHSMDQVRVAMRDPFNPSRWYWYFSGFVSDVVDNSDENNTKTLTIAVEDPTKLFRYTRVFLNPAIIDAKAVISDQDLRIQSFWANSFRGLTLPEIFFTLMFGPDRAGTEKLLNIGQEMSDNTSNLSTRMRGIGHFDFESSTYATFGPQEQISLPAERTSFNAVSDKQETLNGLLDVKSPLHIKDLAEWQTLIDHEVKPSDIWTMASEDNRRDQSAMVLFGSSLPRTVDGIIDSESIINFIGTNPDRYPVDGGRLMMLLPTTFGVGNTASVVQDIIQGGYPTNNSEWHSAGTIMAETVDRIGFCMYCTPKGDIVIEPPLYDFDPGEFGLDPVSGSSIISAGFSAGFSSAFNNGAGSNALIVLGKGESLFPGTDRGPFGVPYTILKRDIYGWESAFTDEKVYTMATCPHQIVQNWESIPNTSIVGDMVVVTLPDLIPLYGVRAAPLTPKGFIASAEAANLYAHMTLNKLNADAHTMSVRHNPVIQMWLNRPIYIEGRNCIATTRKVGHSLTWGASGSMETTTEYHAVRTWNGEVSSVDPSIPIYTTIGGRGGRPLDYSVLFKKADPPKPQDYEFKTFDFASYSQGSGKGPLK